MFCLSAGFFINGQLKCDGNVKITKLIICHLERRERS